MITLLMFLHDLNVLAASMSSGLIDFTAYLNAMMDSVIVAYNVTLPLLTSLLCMEKVFQNMLYHLH